MNTTSLAVIQPEELDTIQRVARLLAVSTYFDGKGDNPQAIAMLATKIMAGRELGFGPFASANGIHIIKGKPGVGANLMASAVKGNGKYDYRVREMSNERCSIEFFERVGDKLESLGISTFTKEDATTAETQNMHKFPRNMLFARAMSNGVKWFVPDVFSGNAVYVPEELGAEVDSDGNVIDTTYVVTKPSVDENFYNGSETTQQAQERAEGNKAKDSTIVDSDYPGGFESELLDSWSTPADAQAWAVSVGACVNIHEARNSFANLVKEEFGGKCTTTNLKQVLWAYMQKQDAKLETLFEASQDEMAQAQPEQAAA